MTSDDNHGTYASPPCLMHELDPACADRDMDVDPRQRRDVMRWRKAERERLIRARLDIPEDVRHRYDARITVRLAESIGDVLDLTVGVYWPRRGEPDLRGLWERLASRGGRTALPAVVERGAPLVFRVWNVRETPERGARGVREPALDAEIVIPDVVIAPMVGFDRACYGLGYGGGFLDRTLAALPNRPRVLGVGYSAVLIPTIYPQPHDIAFDAVVTEAGLVIPGTDAGNAPRASRCR